MHRVASFIGNPVPSLARTVRRRLAKRVNSASGTLQVTPRILSAVSFDPKPYIRLATPAYSLLTPAGSTRAVRNSVSKLSEESIVLDLLVATEDAGHSFISDEKTIREPLEFSKFT